MTEPTTTAATVVDLDGELAWTEHHIAGAEAPARIALLHADAERGTRTVVVRFPDGWSRSATGSQPAGEEMVVLSGALTISGHTCEVGGLLVIEPRATRSATSTLDGTAALVFFSGAGGGWVDGVAEDAGAIELLSVDAGVTRAARPGLVGEVRVLDSAAGATFAVDADVHFVEANSWAFVPAGATAPSLEGTAVVHTWA